jgi:hypothetical protein
VLDVISTLPKRVEAEGRMPGVPMSGRERTRFRLAWLHAQDDVVPALSDLAGRALEKLATRFGPAPPAPMYPAFAPPSAEKRENATPQQ